MLSGDERDEQQDHAGDRRLPNALDRAAAHVVDVETHHERNRDRCSDCEDTPRALGERIHDHVTEPGERDDDDEQDRDGRDDTQRRTELIARDLCE